MAARNADYLIIGNSAAGVSAAEAIRATDADGSVLIVSNEPYAVYGRPLISYMLEGKASQDNLGFKAPDFYEKLRLDTLFGPDFAVESLNPEAHEAVLANGDVIAYGKCLLATGSVPFTPPIEGLEGRVNVHTFFTLDDAMGVWDDARRAQAASAADGHESRCVVIGSGMIGLKAAEAVSSYVDEVLVLELAPRILPAVLDEAGSALLQQQLAKHGITCLPGISANKLCGEGDRVESVVLTDGREVACDFVVAAVGVRPNSALAVQAGAEQGRGLVCGPDLQTSLRDVYAAGDVVQITDELDGAQRPLALWPIALRTGALAGAHMAGAPDAEPFTGAFAVNAVDFFDVSLLTAGIVNPPADGGFEERVFAEGSTYVKFVVRDDRLQGYILFNRPLNAGLYTSLIENATPLSSLEADPFGAPIENLNYPDGVRWDRLHKGYPTDLDQRGWKEA